MQNFVLIDILPFVGDTGVRDTNPRGSQWTPLLAAPITPPPGTVDLLLHLRQSLPRRGRRADHRLRSAELDHRAAGPDHQRPLVQGGVRQPRGRRRSTSLEFFFSHDHAGHRAGRAPPPTTPSPTRRTAPTAWGRWPPSRRRSASRSAACEAAEPRRLRLGGHQRQRRPGRRPDRRQRRLRRGSSSRAPTACRARRTTCRIASTVTGNGPGGAPGWYRFPGLAPGQLLRLRHAAADLRLSPPPIRAADDHATPTPIRRPAARPWSTLAANEDDPDLDFGLVPTQLAALGNYVWFDRNSDGIQNESPFDGANGVTVRLFVDDGDGNPEPGAGDVAGGHHGHRRRRLRPARLLPVRRPDPGPALLRAVRAARLGDRLHHPERGRRRHRRLRRRARPTARRRRDPGAGRGEPHDRRRPDRPPTGTLALGDQVWMDTDNDGVYEPRERRDRDRRRRAWTSISTPTATACRRSTSTSAPPPAPRRAASPAATASRPRARHLHRGRRPRRASPAAARSPARSTSTGNDPAPDPDDDVNGDDNGTDGGRAHRQPRR